MNIYKVELVFNKSMRSTSYYLCWLSAWQMYENHPEAMFRRMDKMSIGEFVKSLL